MKAIQKSLAAAFLFFLAQVSVNAQQKVSPAATGDNVQPVLLTVTVTNGRGEFVTGLKQDNFKVLVDKAPAKIVSFSDLDAPVSIGILLDASGSIGNPRNYRSSKILNEALARFLELSNRSNDYFVIGFNDQSYLLVDWTYDTRSVMAKLTALEPHGNTAFYDACYLGLERVTRGQYTKRAIILISDGQDNVSRHAFKHLRDLTKESKVIIYSINVLNSGNAGSALASEGQGILNELSSISGGLTFYQAAASVKAADVKAFFEVIANELRHQYVIGITPADSSGPRKWHKIRINVSPEGNAAREMKGLSVRTREGYYTAK